MSSRSSDFMKPATGPEAIEELLHQKAHPASVRRVGIEIERIGVWSSGMPFWYEERKAPDGKILPGAEVLFQKLNEKYGWKLIKLHGKPVAMNSDHGHVSLEPGSQLELATRPEADLSTIAKTVQQFESDVKAITGPWGLKWINLGVNPFASVNDVDIIPLQRYHIMTEYLGAKGSLGTSMMRLTASIQINLDYQSEEEAIEMLRVSLLGAPVAYALFANSPFSKGQETGQVSYRQHIWQNTDRDRTGLLHAALKKEFDFATYAKLIWNSPLMYAKTRDGEALPTGGASLAQVSRGKLPGVYSDEANITLALRQFFTESRLKPGYIEVRSTDGQKPAERYGATAFWLGILYHPDARRLVLDTMGDIRDGELDQLLKSTSRLGLKTKFGQHNIKDIATKFLAASKEGLLARGLGEERFLEPIEENLENGVCPADKALAVYRNSTAKKAEIINYSNGK